MRFAIRCLCLLRKPLLYKHKLQNQSHNLPISDKSSRRLRFNPAVTIAIVGFVIQTLPFETTFAQTPPPCTLERGTVNADNTFTAGSSSTDVDLRIRCTGDLTGVTQPNLVHSAYLSELTGLTDQEVQTLLTVLDPDQSVMLIDLSATHSQFTGVRLRIAPTVIPQLYKVVSIGTQTLPSTTMNFGDAISVFTNTANPHFLRLDNYSTIVNEKTSDGNGIQVATGGGIEMRNYSDITTKGSNSFGLYLRGGATAADIYAINEQGATIRTEGAGYPIGIFATTSGTGNVRIVNRGMIVTTGPAIARGIQVQAQNGGNSDIVNEGSIQTAGAGAHGLVAFTQTLGDSNPDRVLPGAAATVHNKAAGTVTTTGDGSYGIRVEHNTTGDPGVSDENWIAEAINEGTITLSGAAVDATSPGARNYGIVAYALGITNNARITNTGIVSATGPKSVGLAAFTQGNGLADIRLTGGAVTAGSTGNFGTGIIGVSQTQFVADESNTDIDVDILVTGQSTLITAYGGTDDSRTTTIDESKAIGIQAIAGGAKQDKSPSTGHSRIRISNGATVNADGGLAVLFSSGRGTLEVESPDTQPTEIGFAQTTANDVNSSYAGTMVIGDIAFATGNYADSFTLTRSLLPGDVSFDGGNDSMTLQNWGSTLGDIDFGAGNDTFIMDVSGVDSRVEGSIRNVETIRKQGTGTVRLNQVATDGSMHIEKGNLVITGDVDVGQGTVTVHDTSRLTFEIGDISVDQDEYGSITAANLDFEGEYAEVYVQFEDGLDDEKLAELREILGVPDNAPVITLINVDTIRHNGRNLTNRLSMHSENDESTIQEVGHIVLPDGTASFLANKLDQIGTIPASEFDPEQINRIVAARSKSSSNSSSHRYPIGLGLLAIMLSLHLQDDAVNAEQGGDSPKYSGKPVRLSFTRVARVEDGTPFHGFWLRSRSSDDPAQFLQSQIRSDTFGWTAESQGGYYIRNSLASNVSINSKVDDASAEGLMFSVGSGLRGDNLFFDLGAAYGEFDSVSGYRSRVTGTFLSGKSSFSTSQVSVSAGGEIDLKMLKIAPTLSLLKGSYRQRAYIARNQVHVAKIPGYRQDYFSRKFALDLRPSNSLNLANGTRMNLFASLSSVRTRSTDASNLDIDVSDKLGILSFNDPAHSGLLPRSINTFMLGAAVRPYGKSNQRVWLNFLNMEYAGKNETALVFGGELRF